MFEVIYMKADYEPWWLFEGWEETILSRHTFQEVSEAKAYLEKTLQSFRVKYENEQMKKECFYAFWTEQEKHFCEACDDDSQIFHGIITFCEGEPFQL